MSPNRPGLSCLSPLALISVAITLLILLGLRAFSGWAMFSPGPLNAQAGEPLGGVASHAKAECAACHPAPWTSETMADRCLACHVAVAQSMDDGAGLHGAMLAGNPGLACAHCHPEHRGPTAALTVIDPLNFPHQAVGFSLAAHANRSDGLPFACDDCHTQRLTSFDPAECANCHAQINAAFTTTHRAQFGNACLACHDGADRYSRFDHATAGFPLTGKHLQADCSACHAAARSPADFKTAPLTCEGCHRADDAHQGRFGSACGVCHTPEGWKPANFDHNLAGFKLEGKHSTVECEQCHTAGYIGTPTDCFSCHQKDDAHSGEFGAQCETCHKPTSWQDATFDHSLSAFPLDGAHLQVACADCHKDKVFKGTPTECAACHADPPFHAGMFPGQACSACHTTAAWRPASYNGPHAFPMDHGERSNTCADCHQPNLTAWTCYPCHDQAEIARKHQEEGISDFADCLACHPTGQKEERGGGGGGDD